MDRPHSWSSPLPFELYRTITENFVDDLQSLCSMCVTCTMLQREAERVLYRRITESFDVWSSIEATKERQERLLFNAILGPNSRLALLVETYALGGLSDYGEEPFWSLLRDGLRAMTNLKWLSIRLSKGRTGTELLDGCSFRLLGLDLGYDSKSSVITFLPLQPDLLHLDVSWSAPAALNTNQSQSQTPNPDSEIRPPSAVCEKLRLLRGNGRTIQELLPGRSKVASLAYRPSQRESIANAAVILRSLSTELGRIRCLLFGGAYRRPGLEIIVDCLQSLEVLHLVTSPDTTEVSLLVVFLIQSSYSRSRSWIFFQGSQNYGFSPCPPHPNSGVHHLFYVKVRVISSSIFLCPAENWKPSTYRFSIP